ncbi:unnamed protein product [Pleuronectes platessa]|uniref:Uncharacterized protein n=1 Tax=Pleuronectes platessa TaxID=8262 RepID=A0A9N7VU75_PLEPL|nr:unnamed protein product [Pleuronectes platessa]
MGNVTSSPPSGRGVVTMTTSLSFTTITTQPSSSSSSSSSSLLWPLHTAAGPWELQAQIHDRRLTGGSGVDSVSGTQNQQNQQIHRNGFKRIFIHVGLFEM